MNHAMVIKDEESVARILHKEWVVDNKLQLGAFTLRPNETYISVNRLSVDSFCSDVSSFVNSHPAYLHTVNTYRSAILNVKDIRGIAVFYENEPVNVDVEVEPRNANIASHAGIFSRVGTTNVKRGLTLPTESLPLGLSADDVLMEIGWSLIGISTIEEKAI